MSNEFFAFPAFLRRALIAALGLMLLAQVARADVERDFLAAREALEKGQMARFHQLAARVPEGHLLSPYIAYWRLRDRPMIDPAWAAFVERHPDTPLAERVRQELARHAGQNEDWPRFRHWAGQLARLDTELRCFSLRERLAAGMAEAIGEGVELYRTGRDMPASCGPLFQRLFERKALNDSHRFARLRLALAEGNTRLARELMAALPPAERPPADALRLAQDKPELWLGRTPENRAERELMLFAIDRLARGDPVRAANLWRTASLRVDEAERNHGWGIVAMHAARRHMPQAVEWFRMAGTELPDTQLAWRTRAMLRAGHWMEVYQSIQAMSAEEQNVPTWRYWRARALKALNARLQANALFAELSRGHDYYAFLASEELPVRFEARLPEYRPSAEEVRAVGELVGIRRALLLRRLGMHAEAGSEWQWAIASFDDARLLAAAEIARREGWYDRAIATAERTRELHNFDLRFLTPYRDLAEAYARGNGLDPAWVYGLMRQESRFVEHARSRVGAMGLMQIMPDTAKWIARQLGLGGKAYAQMNHPETNIRFGTWYLKHVFDSLGGSPVLATAAYNAGPGRARRWQAEVPLEGAIYVDTIPFLETRDYVRKVLANAMHYRQRLGQEPIRLTDKLGMIPARPAARMTADAAEADTSG